MEPTEVMMLGKVGGPGGRVIGNVNTTVFGRDPQWRTDFLNPPPTTPQEPQNLMRPSVMNGLGSYGQVVDLRGGMGGAGMFWSAVGTAIAVALVYHGVQRNPKQPVVGGLLWFLGSVVWPITLPLAFVQGYGKKRKR